MGQVRHESSATKHAVSAALQRSQASLAQLNKGTAHQFQYRREVALAGEAGELEYRTQGAALDCSHRSRGGNNRRIPMS